jgi:hypothetical protein
MRLQIKREALEKIKRHANEASGFDTVKVAMRRGFDTVLIRFEVESGFWNGYRFRK